MSLIIAGGRDFNNYELLKKAVDSVIPLLKDNDIEIVSGVAKGADTLGELYAYENGYTIRQFHANWSDGKRAGYERNEKMAKYANACVCFWDGESRGTKHMIDLANKYQLLLFIFKY